MIQASADLVVAVDPLDEAEALLQAPTERLSSIRDAAALSNVPSAVHDDDAEEHDLESYDGAGTVGAERELGDAEVSGSVDRL